MKHTFTFLIFLCSLSALSQSNYRVIFEADSKGKTISGKRQDLINYVQNGNPIRVGWVLNFKHPKTRNIVEMQHWTDAGFITTLDGHVFAQIKSIYQQGPSPYEPPSVFLVDDKPNGWVAIIGTTGVMRQKYTRDEKMVKMMLDSGLSQEEVDKRLKDMEILNVRTKWAVSLN
ncbi:hypothetical protein [uncultured Croceitalea sp.]|uniref:hypothetical protein n=1 Tax=uncultured Croceitalea sp. TaxID=1798908 RepID=UPI0033066445